MKITRRRLRHVIREELQRAHYDSLSEQFGGFGLPDLGDVLGGLKLPGGDIFPGLEKVLEQQLDKYLTAVGPKVLAKCGLKVTDPACLIPALIEATAALDWLDDSLIEEVLAVLGQFDPSRGRS